MGTIARTISGAQPFPLQGSHPNEAACEQQCHHSRTESPQVGAGQIKNETADEGTKGAADPDAAIQKAKYGSIGMVSPEFPAPELKHTLQQAAGYLPSTPIVVWNRF